MDDDDFIKQSSDSDSNLSEEEDRGDTLLLDIYNFVVLGVKELYNTVKKFPNISQEQQKGWSKSMSRATKSSLPTYKFALVGKTGNHAVSICTAGQLNMMDLVEGSGKSTLVNCVLGTQILPASAAVLTEVRYEDSNTIQGTVIFLLKNEWQEELRQLLEDVQDNGASDSAYRSKEKLLMVYPELRNKALDSVTVSHLLQADVVRSKLGTSFKLPRTDPENFRAILEQYLSSSNNSNTSVLWPLVRRVEVSGRFPVLSTGIVLVDLPGHGDDDDTRNDFASAYIKEADGVILVTDVKRAQHDRETLAYLRKIITQLIIDGRSVEDCILLAATGADASIGDKEIHLEQDVQLKYDRRVKDLKELRKSLHLPKKSKMNKSKQREQQREVEDGIRDIEKDNALLLANVRIAAVTTSLNDFFGELHASLAPDGSATPRLPIFCLGSQDYLALKSGARTLGVFFDEDATEIPGLKTHLRTIGERSRIRWVTRAVDNAEALSEDIHSYFSEGRYPGRLHSQAKKKVLDLIGKLDESNLEEAGNAFDAIKEEFERIEGEVEKAVERAAENSASIMKEFGSRVHHNTYRACMQRNGLYYAHDINRDLTRNILPAIQGSWNGGINHRIPLTLKDATAKIEENTLAAIADISQTLDFQGTALAQSRAIARQPLAIESILSDMLGEAIKSISVAQRDGTRSFSAVIQKELTPQYQSVLKEVKSGSSARMRCSNEAYMTQNGHVVFQAINTHISQLFRDSLARVKHDIRAELQDITTQLRLSLVEEVNLSPDHKETKDKILQLALENRQTFATRKLDLGYRRRSLEMK